ncbi:MAG: hypothetical protein PHP01_03650 [Phycisphaerae bacterium]|nr:hypothetical protein [Phycisphaerae bacterium]
MPETTKQSGLQTIISYGVILIIIGVAAVIGYKQMSFNKTAYDSYTGATIKPADDKKSQILGDELFGPDFSPAAPVENYNSANLYEKIDGKADLYLNNGFVSLQCRRFVSKSAKDNWAEVYFYDMAEPQNGFAVYSMQKRSNSAPLSPVQFGYSVSDSVYAAIGKYYIEISLSADDETLLNFASAAARKIASIISPGKTSIPLLDFFPIENLVPDSFKFIPADAFGCSELVNIFSAEYKINNNTITAFITVSNPAETYKKYHRFLIDNGGEELQHGLTIKDCNSVDLFGTIELFSNPNGYFAGVRGPVPIEDLKQVAEKLFENLSKK